MARCILQYSGGAASAVAGIFAMEEFGKDNVTWLFADTLIEDDDLYRFNADVERVLGVRVTRISEGRTPWEVFFSERMLGNSRADPCSRILKREILDDWRLANSTSADVVFLGMDANEAHRLAGVQNRLAPWIVRSPLIERRLFKEDVLGILRSRGIKPSRAYEQGMSHDNCGGFCVKAGHGHYVNLLEQRPEVYSIHEAKEEAFRRFTGKDVSILRDRTGGVVRPLTLRQFRERYEQQPETIDRFDIGGCNCMTPPDEYAA